MKNERVYCKDCKYLIFSDCYGECSKAYRGIVNPDNYCEHGERRYKMMNHKDNELPITITIGNGEDAYEEVYKVVEKYIKKDDLVKVLEGLVNSREGKNCSRQVIIEYHIYKYVLNIVNTLKTYEYEE